VLPPDHKQFLVPTQSCKQVQQLRTRARPNPTFKHLRLHYVHDSNTISSLFHRLETTHPKIPKKLPDYEWLHYLQLWYYIVLHKRSPRWPK
jgi:hypothetical protein